MASLHERYEREINRINKKLWVTYQWEELVLDPSRKAILQENNLDIPRFKNEEGSKLGRNIKKLQIVACGTKISKPYKCIEYIVFF